MSNFNDAAGNSGTRNTTTNSGASDTGSTALQPLGMSSGSDNGRQTGETVLALLQRVGIDETMVNSLMTQWRGQLSEKVSGKIQEGDLVELLDSAREMARTSGSKLKTLSQANPGLFYSGVAAIMAGAGLLAAAARNADATTSKDDNQDRGL